MNTLNNRLLVFGWAMLISCLGSLPAGILNVTVAAIVVSEGALAGFLFGLGAVLAEVVVVWIALLASKSLTIPRRFNNLLNWAIILLLFVMAASSIKAALQREAIEAALPGTARWPLFSGFFLSAINPFHLPFWLGWTVVLRNKRVLPANHSANVAYIFGIGLGTAIAFFVYGLLAQKVSTALAANQFILNWIIGISLLVAAVVQLVKQCKSWLLKPKALPES